MSCIGIALFFTKYFPEVSATGVEVWTHNDVFQYNLLDIIEVGFINKGKMAGVQAMQPVFMVVNINGTSLLLSEKMWPVCVSSRE